MKLLKTAFIVLIITALIGFFMLGGDQMLSLAAIKHNLSQLMDWTNRHPVSSGSLFFVLYLAVTALSLPAASALALAAGALFGVVTGTVLVSFASSLGALLAFLMSRFVLRSFVERHFAKPLAAINQGIDKEGAFYLFTLRLVPVFPFFLINLLLGLTSMRAGRFYLVSQLGMLAGTFVYVNAGTQLAQIEHLSGILSPKLIFSFALLGIFPLIAKRLIDAMRQRRVYARWQKPKKFDRNLVVIGAGAAGLVAAYIAATVKAKITLVEAHKMGGDCLNHGCVPSKALIQSAKAVHLIRHAENYGLQPSAVAFSFRKVMQRVQDTIAAIAPHDSIERYIALGVDVRQGYARIIDPWTVEIAAPDHSKQRLTTRSIVIATGARPFIPPLPGLETTGFVTSDTLWERFAGLDKPPRRLLILGGGPIGCELAQAFARLGSEVTQLEMAPRLMLREDEEVSALVRQVLAGDGVNVLTGHKALRCGNDNSGKFLIAEGPAGELRLDFDELLVAVGRKARLEGFGLEELGIETQRTVTANEFLETLYPNIFAAGDAAGPYQFTHTASHQAWYAAVNALFGCAWKFKADYSLIPWVTFVAPEVARAGLNEQEANEQGRDYEITRYNINGLDRAVTESHTQGFIKVLTRPGSDKILGVTIVANHAGELLAEFVLAMKHGLGLKKLLTTIHAYPTWTEANKNTASQWQRAHYPEQLLVWVERFHRWRRH